jgi:alpha-beta hydrolase superfamily lysophospholipase
MFDYVIDFVLAKLLFSPTFDTINRHDTSLVYNDTLDSTTQEIKIKTTNNMTLRALYTKTKNNVDILDRKCILYSHGNMGNIYGENKKEHVLRSISRDIDLITYDYQGYGKNLGKSTEKSMYEDIFCVWHHIIFNLKYNPKNIILYGYSLGCVPTLWLGNKIQNCNHIVIQAGFSSLEDVIKELTSSLILQRICRLGAKYILHKKFNNETTIKLIGTKIPITVFHSTEDKLISFESTCKLKKANPHIDIYKTLGSHSIPIYDEHSENKLKKILS